MHILRILLGLIAGAFSILANPFHEGERSFLQELNSMAGIELAGGPFHVGEQHHFEGEFGYFILTPAIVIPSIDQRLSVQTKFLRPTIRSNILPFATSPYTREHSLTPADRREIHTLLAGHGFALRRDEITVMDLNTIQVRPVAHLPLLKIAASTPNTAIALLGAQSWQGIPLYRASFDRTRGDYELETLRENFVPHRRHELPIRPPILSPQTFFAEPGIARDDWTKLLRNFASIDLPALEILETTMSDRLVTVYADSHQPVLPQFWAKLEKADAHWKLTQAIEFRAEFPRPGAWWTFLPLLPETPAADLFPSSSVPLSTRREITSIVTRLRGIGHITSLANTENNSTIRVRTTHDKWRGYLLDFTRIQNTWRFSSVSEWTD
jgi:hypothetical protein